MKSTKIVTALLLTLSAVSAIRIVAQGQTTNTNLINPANLPLETKGSRIVDKNGAEVRLACVNWYGAHMEQYVVNGLDLLDIDEIAQDIANDGFNCIRLPFSLAQYFVDPVVDDSVVKANPSLKGKKSMEVFDITVKALVKAGLMVILNNHNSEAMWCCSVTDGDGLWHNAKYSAAQWEEVLISLTTQYKDEPMVIGNDLRNEIRLNKKNWLNWQNPTWGSGDETTDWKMAAEKVGNAILKVDPTQLIIIEGLNFANDMSPIRNNPIKLDIPNKLVYSFHYYDWQPSVAYFDGTYAQFRNDLDNNVAFMLEEGQEYTAPVWLGEFGTSNQSNNYWSYLIRYLEDRPQLSWAYWAYNGYKVDTADDETFGIVNKDMKTVRHDWKLSDLKKVQKGKKLDQNLLPNVANQVVTQFSLMSLYTAGERHGSADNALYEQIKQREAQLKSDGSGLSQSVLEDIVNMGWDAAWHAANTRAGNLFDAPGDKQRFNQRATSVANSGYFSQTEATHLKWCAWNYAWYEANEIYGMDSASDLEGIHKHCNAIAP